MPPPAPTSPSVGSVACTGRSAGTAITLLRNHLPALLSISRRVRKRFVGKISSAPLCSPRTSSPQAGRKPKPIRVSRPSPSTSARAMIRPCAPSSEPAALGIRISLLRSQRPALLSISRCVRKRLGGNRSSGPSPPPRTSSPSSPQPGRKPNSTRVRLPSSSTHGRTTIRPSTLLTLSPCAWAGCGKSSATIAAMTTARTAASATARRAMVNIRGARSRCRWATAGKLGPA